MSEHLPQCLLLLGLSEESRNYGGPGPLTTGQTDITSGVFHMFASFGQAQFYKAEESQPRQQKRSRETKSVCEEIHPPLLKVALS